MRCQDAREYLELYVLNALPLEVRESVQGHLAVCAHCAEEVSEIEETVRDVRIGSAAVAPRIPSGLRQAVRQEAASRQRKRASYGIFSRFAAVAALAGVVLLGTAVAWRWVDMAPNTGASSAGEARNPDAEGPLASERQPESERILWQLSNTSILNEAIADTPVLQGERVFVLKRDAAVVARIRAIHARTGQVLWNSVETHVRRIAAGGLCVYGLESGGTKAAQVVALDASAGTLLWRADVGTSFLSSSCSLVTAAGGVLVVTDREFRFFSAVRGIPVWTRTLDGKRGPAVAACDSDRTFVAFPGALECLDAADGRLLWTQQLEGGASRLAHPCMAVHGERCYVAQGLQNGGWELSCLNTRTPGLLWKQTAPKFTSHIAADENVVLVRGCGVRQALVAGTGEKLWGRSAEGCGPMSLSGGIAYYVDMSGPGFLVASDARSGRILWREQALRSCAQVLVRDDVAYLNSRSGCLYAIRATESHR